jgi:hypothetical protein
MNKGGVLNLYHVVCTKDPGWDMDRSRVSARDRTGSQDKKNLIMKIGDRVLIPRAPGSVVLVVCQRTWGTCCNHHMFDGVDDIAPHSHHDCDCRMAHKHLDLPDRNEMWIPMPTRPTRRSSFQVGEKVYVAWKCANVTFRILPVTKDVPEERCCWVEDDAKVSYDNIYTLDQASLNERCRAAVDTWLRAAMRMKKKKWCVPKDVRLLIGTAIWATADDVEWAPDHNRHRHSKPRASHKKIKFY